MSPSILAAQALVPAWLNQLAPKAVLVSTVLDRAVHGRDAIITVIQTAGSMYEAHKVVFHAMLQDRELLEYDALAFGGIALHGVVTMRRNTDGEIIEVGVHHGPIGAANKLSAALGARLGSDLGAEYFLP